MLKAKLHYAIQVADLVMAALWNRAGHYIFALRFLSSIYLLLSFFSSRNLSGRRLDVYHTSTHGVALVRVWNLLHAARWKYRTQKIAILAPSHKFVGLYLHRKAYIDNQKKKLVKHDTSSTCPHNMVNFGQLTAEICWRVWGHPFKFQWVSHLGSVTARHFSSGRQPNFAALNRGRHLHSAG